jgi:hypothetical protein
LTVSLPICIPFIPSSCFIPLARNSKNMLNRSGESGHPCLLLDLRGNGFSFSPDYVGCRFVIYNLYSVEVHSYYS